MKNSCIKTRVFWVAGTVMLLFISFLLCRYAFFFLHGNRQWSGFMLIIALVVTGIAAIFDGRRIMIFTVIGYIGGFALGQIFNVRGVDPDGGGISNWWIIWTFSFLIITAIGIIAEVAGRFFNRRRV